MSLSNGSLAPGTVIDDKFRIEKVLGEGAVGVVVRALHLKLGTPVALKFLLSRMLGDAIVVERFAREARAAARLTSDHVARVLDVGNIPVGGAPYMVMEYLSGETLGDAMKRRRIIPVNEACSYMIQVCDALTEAHSLGIIHRDLKPANLFLALRPNGKTVVKVLDFGISKMDNSKNEEGEELTMASSILGTPLYMAPEQISSSRTVDGRADVWSCGIVLHRMLCGIVPFDADSLIELGAKLIKQRPPRLDALRADIPTDLANTVIRCLERDVQKRWQTAADLANALARYAVPTGSGASPAAIDDDEVEPTLALPAAIMAAYDLPHGADQAETLTIVSGHARTQAATPPPPAAGRPAPPKPPPAPPQREPPVLDITLNPVPVLGVKRKQKNTADVMPFEDQGAVPSDRTRVAAHPHASGQMEQMGDDDGQMAQDYVDAHHGGSYPPAYPDMTPRGGSRNAPTVLNNPPPQAQFLDGIEKHPFFGVILVFLLALFIAVSAVYAFQSGCFR